MSNSTEQTGREAAPAENGAKISERESQIRSYLQSTQDDPFHTNDARLLVAILDAERLRIIQLKRQIAAIHSSMFGLVVNWRSAAMANDRVAEKHAAKYGTGNDLYAEAKERARTLQDCAEHLQTVIEKL